MKTNKHYFTNLFVICDQHCSSFVSCNAILFGLRGLNKKITLRLGLRQFIASVAREAIVIQIAWERLTQLSMHVLL